MKVQCADVRLRELPSFLAEATARYGNSTLYHLHALRTRGHKPVSLPVPLPPLATLVLHRVHLTCIPETYVLIESTSEYLNAQPNPAVVTHALPHRLLNKQAYPIRLVQMSDEGGRRVALGHNVAPFFVCEFHGEAHDGLSAQWQTVSAQGVGHAHVAHSIHIQLKAWSILLYLPDHTAVAEGVP